MRASRIWPGVFGSHWRGRGGAAQGAVGGWKRVDLRIHFCNWFYGTVLWWDVVRGEAPLRTRVTSRGGSNLFTERGRAGASVAPRLDGVVVG